MNNKKKKHIYSKDKKLKIEKENGTFSCRDEVYLYLFGLDDTMWGRFVIDVINNKKQLPLDKQENVKYILNELEDNGMRNNVLRTLLNLTNYNPFVDKFPIMEFSKDIQNHLSKKQKFIKNYYRFRKVYKKENIKILFRYNNNEINIKMLLQKYEIICLFNSHSCFFFSKKDINLTNLFDYLNKEELGKWLIEKNKNRIYLKQGYKTKFFIPNELNKIVNNI